MTTQNKCGFCDAIGHTIQHCNSEMATIMYNNMKSRAIDYFTSNQGTSIHSRATLFQGYLKDTYSLKELRVILAKMCGSTSGNKTAIIARIVLQHFFLRLGYRDFQDTLSFNDRVHMDEYTKYWWNLSLGVSIITASAELNDYFEFVNSMEVLDFGNFSPASVVNVETTVKKFPILISMKAIDLTETQGTETFDCPICMEDECSVLDQVEMGCNHSFCKECVVRVMDDSQKKGKDPCCALCRQDYKRVYVHTGAVLESLRERFCSLVRV